MKRTVDAEEGSGRTLLYVANADWYFVSHRLELAQAARLRGWHVHVAAPEGDAGERIRGAGLCYHPIPMRRWKGSPLAEFHSFVSLIRLLRNLRPDVIHPITVKPIVYGGVTARLTGVPAVVNTVAGLGQAFAEPGVGGTLLRWIVWKLYGVAFGHPNQVTIFQNEEDRMRMVMEGVLSEEESAVIASSGVDLERFRPSPIPDSAPLVILASRLLWHKGVMEFVEAARLLKREHPDWRFALVGKPDRGHPGSVPGETLTRWSEEEVVEVWGFREDMPEVLAQATLCCLPSFYPEGVPRILIEAAAAGRPVVTTCNPGCQDAVDPGRTGCLVEPQNAIALADAIRRILETPGCAEAFGRMGRQMVESRFSLEGVVEATLELYERTWRQAKL